MVRDASGSGPWLMFLVTALALVLGVIGYLVARGDLFGVSARPAVSPPRLLAAPLPAPPPLPRPTPSGAA